MKIRPTALATLATLATAATLSTLAVSAALASPAAVAADGLPPTMTWSSYDVGSSGYAGASAIADAFGREFGTRIRIQPSSSSIGRLQPVLTRRADLGFLGNETFFAAEGIHDFAARRWGPQDLRMIAGKPSAFGVFTAFDANIKEIKDLKGMRVAYAAGNPAVNVKCDALLAFGGLSRSDVKAIMFPTYTAALSSVAQNQSDASCTTTTPGQLYELKQSPRGIRWLNLPADNKEGWARLTAIAPFFQPYTETVGAGISKENPVHILAYRYPSIVVRADASEKMVYAIIKGLDQTYGLYQNATKVMHRWKLDDAAVPPTDVPFHAGAIRYLKERGLWSADHQAWNDQRLARLNALRAEWPKAIAQGKGKSDDEFAAIWEQHRLKVLGSLTP